MSLIDNGLDSFKKAFDKLYSLNISHSGTVTPYVLDDKIKYDLKDVILGFHHSFEVLFKALLDMKDPFLIYADLNNYFDSKFSNLLNHNSEKLNKLQTITFIQAFKRVVISYPIKIDYFCYNNILQFNELRNSLTHSGININHQQTCLCISNLLLNIIPILDNINEFKVYIKENSILEKLNNIQLLNNELLFQNIIYLAGCTIQNLTTNKLSYTDTEKIKYKRALQYIGYVCTDELNQGYISEFKYILNKFEEILYLYGNPRYNYITANDNVLSLIKAHADIIDSTTFLILKEKVINDLSILLSVYSENNGNFLNENFSKSELKLYELYKNLNLSNKFNIGLNIKQIDSIIEMWKNFFSKDEKLTKNAKLIKNTLPYTFSKTTRFNLNLYEYAENGEFKFEFSLSQYLDIMKKLFSYENIIFQNNSSFEKYISPDINKKLEEFFINETWDFFWEKFMGRWGNWGTIDNIDEIYFYEITAICNIVDYKEFTIWSKIMLGLEYYSDHEYYSDGTLDVDISLKITIDEKDKPHFSNLEILN